MSWVIKILLKDYKKTEKIWTGANFSSTPKETSDFIINDFKFSESTWREVEYSPIEQEDLINKQDISNTLILNSSSKRYQFLNPIAEKVAVILPTIPKYNQKYIIKNLSNVNNLIEVKEKIGGPTIYILDSTDEYSSLFHDGIEWQITI